MGLHQSEVVIDITKWIYVKTKWLTFKTYDLHFFFEVNITLSVILTCTQNVWKKDW